MKKVILQKLTKKELQNAINEVRILASINDPNIISYNSAFYDKKSQCLCIIMEYANDQDLLKKIQERQKKSNYFKEDDIWKIIIQIVRGLKSLHALNIIHRDIKSANVFLNKDGTAKLGDLNVAKVVTSLGYTQTGTPYYASPEVWKDQPYDQKSDIWSLGCVIYEMTALKMPFNGNNKSILYKKILEGIYNVGHYEEIPSIYSKDLSRIIKRMLMVIPHLRPSCSKNKSAQILEKFEYKIRSLKMTRDNEEENWNQNHLLKPIEIPTNLALLTERLPKSKIFKEIAQKSKNVRECFSLSSNFNQNQDLNKTKEALNGCGNHSENNNNIKNNNSLILPNIKMKNELNLLIVNPYKNNLKKIFKNNLSMIESIIDKQSERTKDISILDNKYYSPNPPSQIINKNFNEQIKLKSDNFKLNRNCSNFLKDSPLPESFVSKMPNIKSNSLANLKPLKLNINLNKIERQKSIEIANYQYQFKRHVPTKSFLEHLTLDE